MTDADTEASRDPAELDAAGYPVLPQETLEALVRCDRDALAELFDAYFDRVYGFVRRMVGAEHLAEDLTQDIFLHLHQALPKYDPTRDLRPWVFTIATNKIRDFWRSRRHRDTQRERSMELDEETTLQLPADVGRPEELLTRTELDAGLREAIEELPDGLRATVVMRVFEGLSFEEIGAVLDRNEVAVRKRYSRALEALRVSLAKRVEES